MAWITNHASKLRRLGSKLEFFVRQEEVTTLFSIVPTFSWQFLSLVYLGSIVEALHFAQVRKLPISFHDSISLPLQEHLAPLVVDSEETSGEASEKSAQSTPNRTPESTPPRNRATSLGSHPRNAINGIDLSSIRPSTFALPFSFPANPLSFLTPSSSLRTPRSDPRTPTEPPLTRESRSMTIGCDTPPMSSEQNNSPSKSSVDYSPLPLTIEDQSAYIKEAMRHLMSMLAFGSQGLTGGRGQGSFTNVVPDIYLPESKPLRLRYLTALLLFPPRPSPLLPLSLFRYLVDLFHLEVRRVYRFVLFPLRGPHEVFQNL
jgi:hypothetical protein